MFFEMTQSFGFHGDPSVTVFAGVARCRHLGAGLPFFSWAFFFLLSSGEASRSSNNGVWLLR